MYQKKIPADIRWPLEYGLEIFGGKWKPRISIIVYNILWKMESPSYRKVKKIYEGAVLVWGICCSGGTNHEGTWLPDPL